MVVINNRDVDVLDFKVCCQRHDQQLDNGHYKNHRKQRFVPKDLFELLLKKKPQCSHANRILNLRMLTINKKRAIPARMSVSFQIAEIPSPLIMMDFTIM